MDIFNLHLDKYTFCIVVGFAFGLIARLFMLQTDYRQYPTYPHGKIIHISLGMIAAGLGAVAVPALLEKNYTAVTFLALAAQQFRDVRNMERNSLQQVDKQELVPRGNTYIEGIAMVFEGRNYLVIFTSFSTTLFCTLAWYYGLAAGIAALIFSHFFKKGKSIVDIANVEIAQVRIDGPDVFVGDIYMMNVGLKESQEVMKKKAVGLLVKPKNMNSRSAFANIGQRQAILHDVSTVLGVYRDSGEPSLTPIAKLNMESGILGVLLLPQDQAPEKARLALMRVPVLENAVRMPSESAARQGQGKEGRQ